MLSILVIILISCSVRCEDWCSYITSNNTYKGLRIYRHFGGKDNDTYFMFDTGVGLRRKWKFTINQELSIKMVDGSSNALDDPEAINKIGLYVSNKPEPDRVCTVKKVLYL